MASLNPMSDFRRGVKKKSLQTRTVPKEKERVKIGSLKVGSYCGQMK